MARFCVHCAQSIPNEVMRRARYKALFCSQECKAADRTAIRASRGEYRAKVGLCPSCGRKVRRARVQMQGELVVE